MMRKAARDFCPEEWERRAEERQSGGKTVKGWRGENGVTPGTYYYRLSKALRWENNGFAFLHKRLEYGSFRWPRKEAEARLITARRFLRLTEGLSTERPAEFLKGFKDYLHTDGYAAYHAGLGEAVVVVGCFAQYGYEGAGAA